MHKGKTAQMGGAQCARMRKRPPCADQFHSGPFAPWRDALDRHALTPTMRAKRQQDATTHRAQHAQDGTRTHDPAHEGTHTRTQTNTKPPCKLNQLYERPP